MAKFNLNIETQDGAAFTFPTTKSPKVAIADGKLTVETKEGPQTFPLDKIAKWSVAVAPKVEREDKLSKLAREMNVTETMFNLLLDKLGISLSDFHSLYNRYNAMRKASHKYAAFSLHRNRIERTRADRAAMKAATAAAAKSTVVASSVEDAPIGTAETLSFSPAAPAPAPVETKKAALKAEPKAEPKFATVTRKSVAKK